MIDDRAFQTNWCATFGHVMSNMREVCKNCGKTAVEIHATQRLVQTRTRRRSAKKDAAQ